jgi:hypothetical protein
MHENISWNIISTLVWEKKCVNDHTGYQKLNFCNDLLGLNEVSKFDAHHMWSN